MNEFMDKAKLELCDISVRNLFWCKVMISRMRKLRAKQGPNFTFQIVSSSEEGAPHSSREKLFCEVMSLSHIRLALSFAISASKDDDDDDDDKFNECLLEWKDEVDDYFYGLKQHFELEFDDPKTNSGWYSEKIAEARMIISKCEPTFSVQSQDVESAYSINISLHEELLYEIKLLIRLKLVDMLTANDVMEVDVEDLEILLKKELQKWINEVNNFLKEINLQLREKNLEKSSDWYHNKIAGSRMLIAKRYSAFSFPSQVVGSTKKQYQIFLSFRGKDTRFSFARNLYGALKQQGFNVFMDDLGLERGDSISQVLMGAIDNSKLSIIILSKHFADSSWCLDEVVKILECKRKKNQLVWPFFYKVEPSDVSNQNKTYGEAMDKHKTRYRDDVIMNWRSALHEVCCDGFNAFSYKKNSGYECDFIQSIVSAATQIRDGS
ncbi:uncharacterized protein LOC130733189 isoform X2 [Lotus japonicus]|uniref:uncharacterized protein LOC130733189 isoform X2 n=1 Tax=Lotus japonicus TaxID=34305 RepID=UPI00258766B3|nr:uncharacterized protein LOC130733189 isoform X2 [Lotus japonicus]